MAPLVSSFRSRLPPKSPGIMEYPLQWGRHAHHAEEQRNFLAPRHEADIACLIKPDMHQPFFGKSSGMVPPVGRMAFRPQSQPSSMSRIRISSVSPGMAPLTAPVLSGCGPVSVGARFSHEFLDVRGGRYIPSLV